MLVSEFDYELPEELIAQRPAPERTASRLLHLDARSGEIEDLAFADLPAQLGEGDTVVLNDTRVIRRGSRAASGPAAGSRCSSSARSAQTMRWRSFGPVMRRPREASCWWRRRAGGRVRPRS